MMLQEALIASTRTFAERNIQENPAPDDFFEGNQGITNLHSKALILAGLWEDEHHKEHLELALKCLKPQD